MVRIRRWATVATAAILLAGCGGGHAGTVLPPAAQSDGVAREPQGTPPYPPTLYVAGRNNLSLYDRTTTTPTFTGMLGAYYNAADGSAIAGVAALAKGGVSVLQNYGGTEGPSSPSCQIWTYARAGGMTFGAAAQAYFCSPSAYYAAGMVAGPNGELDVLDTTDPNGSTGWQVERFFAGQASRYSSAVLLLPRGTVASPRTYTAIGAGAQGNIFVARDAAGAVPARIEKYAALATGHADPTHAIDLPAAYTTTTALAATKGSLYAMMVDTGAATSWPNPITPTLSSIGPPPGTLPGYPGVRYTAAGADVNGVLFQAYTIGGSTELDATINNQNTLLWDLYPHPAIDTSNSNVVTGIAASY